MEVLAASIFTSNPRLVSYFRELVVFIREQWVWQWYWQDSRKRWWCWLDRWLATFKKERNTRRMDARWRDRCGRSSFTSSSLESPSNSISFISSKPPLLSLFPSHQTALFPAFVSFLPSSLWCILLSLPVKADSHIACRAHAVPPPCRAAKGLECVFPIWFTQCGCVWFTLAMPHPCPALAMPFFSWPRHSTATGRRPVGYLPVFGFFRLPHGVPRRLLSEAYQSSQRSIPTTVKSGSNTLQNRRSVKLLD